MICEVIVTKRPASYQRAIQNSILCLVQHHFRFEEDDKGRHFTCDFVFSTHKALEDPLVRNFLVNAGVISDYGRLDRHFPNQNLLTHARGERVDAPTYPWNRHLFWLDIDKANILNRGIEMGNLPEIVSRKRRDRQVELVALPTKIEADLRLDE